jgi:5-methylthioribose kinase
MLLAGQADPSIARTAGNLLGTLHAEGWHDSLIAEEIGDRQFFIELRLDPYYRQLSRIVPHEGPQLASLIEQVLENRHTLVHADFSPKNLLVSNAGLMLVDFETGHYGDPAFDIGFFLAHLLLKAVYHAPRSADYLGLASIFWNQYVSVIQPRVPADEIATLERRTIVNMAACLWARLDGKSKIDYLTEAARRDLVRRLARAWLYEPSALCESFSQLEIAAGQLPSRS